MTVYCLVKNQTNTTTVGILTLRPACGRTVKAHVIGFQFMAIPSVFEWFQVESASKSVSSKVKCNAQELIKSNLTSHRQTKRDKSTHTN